MLSILTSENIIKINKEDMSNTILSLGFSNNFISSLSPIKKKIDKLKMLFILRSKIYEKIVDKTIKFNINNKPPALGVGFKWNAWGFSKFLSIMLSLSNILLNLDKINKLVENKNKPEIIISVYFNINGLFKIFQTVDTR